MRLVTGSCSRLGRLHGRVELEFSSGEELRSGPCVLSSKEKGLR